MFSDSEEEDASWSSVKASVRQGTGDSDRNSYIHP